MNRNLFSIGLGCLIALFFITDFADAKDSRPIVRLIYFLPKDRQPQEDIDAKMDGLIKTVQKFYADEMERHGFGRKTFLFEADANDKAIVHHVRGKFNDVYYHGDSSVVWKEIGEQFGEQYYRSNTTWLTALDISSKTIGTPRGSACGTASIGYGSGWGGALLPASGHCFNWFVTAHELGHTFGLQHDFRNDAYIMSYGITSRGQLSPCSAEWLDVHRCFNSNITDFDERATIKMLSPSFVSPPNTIRLRFEVTDTDGLHQAQLFANRSVFACKRLNGTRSTVEFVTAAVTPKTDYVSIRLIDAHGNISEKGFRIDITPLLPPPEVVSIPDANLAAAVRAELGLPSSAPITTYAMLDLISIDASDSGITDLTGLQHAIKLTRLFLYKNSISDIFPLAGMKYLKVLSLSNNTISDVSPLAGMKHLTRLGLDNNAISDVSPLVGLNLTDVSFDGNGLHLKGNPLSYASIHTHIPAMQAKGIKVSFDNVAHPALLKISGHGQNATAGTALTSPFVVEVQDGNGAPMPDVAVRFAITHGNGVLGVTDTTTGADGRAQTTLALGWKPGRNSVRVKAEGIVSFLIFTANATPLFDQIAEDVNGDGVVDVEDLVLVAASLGTTPPDGAMPNTDINGDGGVTREDMELVLAALESTPAAPAALWTAANLQRWIDAANRLGDTDEFFQRGIAVLEQLLASLLPKQTALLPNYPNPFNPETWIPYHLAKRAEVTVGIYAINGTLIRTLALGHQSAGLYEERHRAAYWDGRNVQGERVASGIYFYTLTAGEFTSTRKMLIRK